MDLKRLFRPNLLLDVSNQKGNKVYYKSIIQEVNKDYLAIGLPMKQRDSLILSEGDIIGFRLTAEDALYFFKSRVLGTKFGDQIPLYLISWPEEVERQQRRQYFRFTCLLDLHYCILPAEGLLYTEKQMKSLGGPQQRGVILNISGGGLMFVAEHRLPVDTLLALRLNLRTKEFRKELLLKGKILRVVAFQRGRTVCYRHALRFLAINEKNRDEIIRFIFTISRQKIRARRDKF